MEGPATDRKRNPGRLWIGVVPVAIAMLLASVFEARSQVAADDQLARIASELFGVKLEDIALGAPEGEPFGARPGGPEASDDTT